MLGTLLHLLDYLVIRSIHTNIWLMISGAQLIFSRFTINKCVQTLRIYLYDQQVKLQISANGILQLEDREVYTRPVTLYKGLDNVLRLLVKTPDQKAVDITNLTFQAELMRSPQQDWVADFTATTTVAASGDAQIVIPASVLNPAPTGFYHLLVRYTDSGNVYPAYIDDNYSVAIPVDLRLGYRVPGDEYEEAENLDLGSLPELVDEIRDLGAF